jgi:predicted transposase/invertase (TIGR01784 family)
LEKIWESHIFVLYINTEDMERFINPFSDVGFKRIFGQEDTKDLLIDFLNDLLVNERIITDITFMDKEILPVFKGFRGAIYDIYCTDSNGTNFIVEMQNGYQTYFRERALFLSFPHYYPPRECRRRMAF